MRFQESLTLWGQVPTLLLGPHADGPLVKTAKALYARLQLCCSLVNSTHMSGRATCSPALEGGRARFPRTGGGRRARHPASGDHQPGTSTPAPGGCYRCQYWGESQLFRFALQCF